MRNILRLISDKIEGIEVDNQSENSVEDGGSQQSDDENIEEKTLISVYFSEETKYEVWTIKNGGVNGDTDTEKREGTFSDLKQDTYISMTGSYRGNDFYAKQVIIHYYI